MIQYIKKGVISLQGLLLGRRRNKSRGTLTSHFHDSYEIYFLAEGRMNYIIHDRIYEVHRHDAVLIPSGVIHNTSYGETPAERLLINFDISLLPDADKELCEVFSRRIISLREPYLSEFKDIYARLEREVLTESADSRRLASHYLAQLLIIFSRCETRSDEVQLSGYAVIMQSAMDYMNDNLSQPITLTDIAARYSLSPSFFSRKFKEQTGFCFSEYLMLMRIRYAKELLRREPLSVTEVAYASGFNDSSYFAKIFKRLVGVAPHKYKNAISANATDK